MLGSWKRRGIKGLRNVFVALKKKKIVEVIDRLQVSVEAFRLALELAIQRIEKFLKMGKEEITAVDVRDTKTPNAILKRLI